MLLYNLYIFSQIISSSAKFLDYGFIGTVIFVLIVTLVVVVRYFYSNQKGLIDLINSERKQKDAENNALEKEFRLFLITTHNEQMKIIQENTEAYRKMSLLFESNLSLYSNFIKSK
ncbi:MAG: hypothetical protein JXR68_12085 [Bacteroidales bacterium]|nr:hypothetical protein [Bacteroidales bacterium]